MSLAYSPLNTPMDYHYLQNFHNPGQVCSFLHKNCRTCRVPRVVACGPFVRIEIAGNPVSRLFVINDVITPLFLIDVYAMATNKLFDVNPHNVSPVSSCSKDRKPKYEWQIKDF